MTALGTLLLAGPAPASDRAASSGGKLQLVPGAVTGTTAEFGLVIDLAPGWKTYWRTPGESGVPPRFEVGPSQNVASLAVDFPAPHRFGAEEAPSIGYTGRIVLPIRVSLTRAGQPARLTLNINLGLCREICIPLSESLTADLAHRPEAAALQLIDEARQAVPRPASPADGPFATIAGLSAEPGKPARLTFAVAAPDGRDIEDVLVEGGENWDLPQPVRRAGDTGRTLWTLDLDGAPEAVPGGRHIRLTMVAGGEAREQDLLLPDLAAK